MLLVNHQQWHYGSSQLRWIGHVWLLVPLCFLVLGCRHVPPDPSIRYEQIHVEFLSGHLDRAEQAAGEQWRALETRRPVWSTKFRLLDAEILSFQGRSQDVVQILNESHTSAATDKNIVIKRAILLSLAYARLDQAALSAEELHQAQELAVQTHSDLESEVLRTQGLLARRYGKTEEAEQALHQSLNMARVQKARFVEASDLLNLGTVALQTEHIDEALDRFNGSSQIASEIGANVILQAALGNAGWAYYKLGDYERALASFRQAEAQAKALGVTDNEILWLQREGLSLYRLNDMKQAQRCYEEALSAAESKRDEAQSAVTDVLLAQLLLEAGQTDVARQRADEALELAQKIKDIPAELDAQFIQGQVALNASDLPEANRILKRIYGQVSEEPSFLWETEDAFANLFAAQHRTTQASLWYQKAIKTFETQRSSVGEEELRLPFLASGDMLYRDYAEFLLAGHRDKEALSLLDDARARTLKEGLGEGSHAFRERPEQIATRLHATILFYWLGRRRSYLWAVERNGIHLFSLPSDAEIAVKVKSYQAAILRSSDPLGERSEDSQWLYAHLVAPAAALLAKDARVFVIPSGSLSGFNMETLLEPQAAGSAETPRYWIEDARVSVASSIQLLAGLPQDEKTATGLVKKSTNKLLLMGDPTVASSEYPSLPHAATEVSKVVQYFPADDRTVLTQAAAVPAAYAASRPEEYAYIHFVAHGIANNLRPLDSAIALAAPAGDPDDFKLYARDIIRQPLHARLVTISACYGSGIRNYDGEGRVGLSWAFLRAGAHQVIGALWEVNDSSTPQLMEQMYGTLAEGEPPDQSLRAAKLAMLHGQGVFRKPLYWAAFQLYAGS